MYSADGITWSNWSNFDPRGRAFNTSVPLSNGSFFEVRGNVCVCGNEHLAEYLLFV